FAASAIASETANGGKVLALVGATIYPSPAAAPIRNGVVLIRGEKIVAVGTRQKVTITPGATVVNCDGLFLVAGFQNSHVHFTEPKWENVAAQPAARVSAQVQEMFLRYGFTTVVDTGSLLPNTLALRNRIEAGEVRGPRILTAGTPIYPENGVPYYVRGALPAEVLALLPTPKTGGEAAAIANRQLTAGADIVKLFTGSWVERGRVLPMSLPVATAAATEAHRHKKLVFAHASNIAGLEVAIQARVDVVAHALDDDRGLNDAHFARMKANNMALIPTLKLFGGQSFTKYIQQEVASYARVGGEILFGTDVGYLTDYDPAEEYRLMSGAGLDWRQILASLTTAPANRFGEGSRRGRMAAGQDADIVVLSSDPAVEVEAFTDVRYTVRAGWVVYQREASN
ncbi:MAG: amidohydrolase family protein, partial [Acidobacteriales bacterium]|nr:amidohydrolase family protein [Terriglobales bacterium]